ncbi:relaxase domain-containing protein [Microvirga aerilata]|uniref:Relaxase domain-containing protein n=1 Tax=Microvirga aerilata TaxID=670292 RepID=A0A936ZAC2_9HYPH|nr:MobF family relaxase [Microvirga aerilata]MBL0406926.1 relaxase domain-containing protein [Microvirga aerilata]
MLNPFRMCPDQGEVDGRVLRDLAWGRDPETQVALVRLSANGRRSVGYDLQCAAPKSVSVLAAFAAPESRSKILAAHDRAVRRTLDYALEAGLVVARTGPQGVERTPAHEVSAAIYRHFTSRAQDPQLHSHAVMLNLAVRRDGTTGAIDNRDILRSLGALAALYRSELASGLRTGLGFEPVRKGRNFEIAGVPRKVLERFSKRRLQIEQAAGEGGFDTAVHRAAAQVAAFGTREVKDREMPLALLEERWARELATTGWRPDSLFRLVAIEAERIRMERDPEPRGRERATTTAVVAVHALTATEVVFDRSALMRRTLEAVQCACTADEGLALVEDLVASGLILAIGRNEAGTSVYATAALVEAERDLLRTALRRRGERDFVPEIALEGLLSRPGMLSEAQGRAVRHALDRDGISLIESPADAGASLTTAIADAARECGKDVWTVTPSWSDGDCPHADVEAAAAAAWTVQAFTEQLRTGAISLDENAVVVCVEADLVATRDMAALVGLVSEEGRGAKLVLIGDTARPRPAIAGAPMAALVRALGAEHLTNDQYQRAEWQRAASRDFIAGDPVRALEAYDRAGLICWADDRHSALESLVDDYVAARQAFPDASRPAGNGPARIILTGRTRDVAEITNRVRAALRERAGLGEEVLVHAIPPGSREPVMLALAAGDDVVFGEDLQVQGQIIRPLDLARVERIQRGPDPTFTLMLARTGAMITTRLSALVGVRAGQAQAPKMQHGYVLPVQAAAGLIVDDGYVANLRGLGREGLAIAMTRHRRHVRLYVDTSRVQVPRAAGAWIRKAVMEEARLSERKRNVSDYAPCLRAFVGVAPSEGAGSLLNTSAGARSRVAGLPGALAERPGSVGLAAWQGSAAIRALRERIAERLSGPCYPLPEAKAEILARADARRAGHLSDGNAASVRKYGRLWHMFSREPNEHLLTACNIAPEVLQRFRADIRTAPDGRAAFAHRDLAGRITGVEYEGPAEQGKVARLHIPVDGERALTQIGDSRNPVLIYVARSSLEGLSLYQSDHSPERALLVSLAGHRGGSACGRFRELVRRWPGATIQIAADNDDLGRGFAHTIEEQVREAGGANAAVQIRMPADGFWTWNDQILGWTRAMAAALQAGHEARMRAKHQKRTPRRATQQNAGSDPRDR